MGWLREEFEHHGLPSTARAAVVEEKVSAIGSGQLVDNRLIPLPSTGRKNGSVISSF